MNFRNVMMGVGVVFATVYNCLNVNAKEAVWAENLAVAITKVEQYVENTYPVNSTSRRLQKKNLERILQSKQSEAQKISELRNKFPDAFSGPEELNEAKSQGVKFSTDGKTLKHCPARISSLIIPSCVTEIGRNAFRASKLQSVTIPNSVTKIGDNAFYGCGLRNVIIPDSVTEIGYNAFKRCHLLQSVTISNSVTKISDGAFENCKSLQSVTISNSVTKIGYNVFYGCESLQSVTIPNSVTTIDSSAFYGCRNLQSVTIPNSVTTIGDSAFAGVWKVEVANNHPVFVNDESGALIDLKHSKLYHFPSNYQGSYKVPSGVTAIGSHAFYSCGSLRNVIIPDSVTEIGRSAFYDCTNLQSLEIPESCRGSIAPLPLKCKVIRR